MPREYNQAEADKVCELIMDGYSLRKIAAIDGMPSKQDILRWLRENTGFQAQYAHAREEQADALAEEIIDIADDISRDIVRDEDGKPIIDGFAAQRAKVMIDSRKWVAAKLKPKKYGDKIDLNHGGQPSNPLSVILSSIDGQSADIPSDTE